MKFTQYALGFVVGVLCLFSKCEAGNLHAMIVSDTIASNIGTGVFSDYLMMRQEIQKIGLYTEMPIKEYCFIGTEILAEKIIDSILKMHIEKDDAVVFYFSGHGHRMSAKGNNPWPDMYISASGKSVDFSKVVQMILKKNPRLVVAISDSCNSWIADSAIPSLDVSAIAAKGFNPQTDFQTMKNKFQSLFCKSRGLAIVSGSNVGQVSWVGSSGSIFTRAFLWMLGSVPNKYDDVSWARILENASLMVEKKQQPQFLYIPSIQEAQNMMKIMNMD